MSSPDVLWKGIIKEMFPEFLLFFAPEVYEQVNFGKEPQFLEQELNRIIPKGETNNRRCDSLVKLYFKDGKEQWFLVHVEVQGYDDKEFAKRMFQYYYRILDQYDKSIFALAIFSDGDPAYNPSQFTKEFFTTSIQYNYQTYKILEQSEEELVEQNNPFALAILAGLYAIQSKKKQDQAITFKLKLIRILLQKGYGKAEIEKLFIFIENLITLRLEENDRFQEQLYENYGKGFKEMDLTLEGSGFAKYWEERGMEKGKHEEKLQIARKMLSKGMSTDVICEMTQLSLEEVKALTK